MDELNDLAECMRNAEPEYVHHDRVAHVYMAQAYTLGFTQGSARQKAGLPEIAKCAALAVAALEKTAAAVAAMRGVMERAEATVGEMATALDNMAEHSATAAQAQREMLRELEGIRTELQRKQKY